MHRRFSPISSLISSLLSRPRALAFGFAVLAASSAGCTPKIGDKCVLSTDCSTQGDKQCDTSMPDGYCTVYNCGPNGCPDYAACYLFHPAVQGCEYNDRTTSRTSKSFCMAGCKSDGDCRTSEGYHCVDARQSPWDAILLDDNQNQKVCMPPTDSAFEEAYASADGGVIDFPDGQAPVCQAYPDVDAAFPASSVVDAGIDAAVTVTDAAFDATLPDAAQN